MNIEDIENLDLVCDEEELEKKREQQLLEDEKPLDFNDDDCEGCKI